MRFRLGLVTGLATGYYLGARAGRQRYDQMNRALAKLRRSEGFQSAVDDARTAVEGAAERAKSAVEEGVGKARAAVDNHTNAAHTNAAHTNGSDADDDENASGIILPGTATGAAITDPPMGPEGYSSSR